MRTTIILCLCLVFLQANWRRTSKKSWTLQESHPVWAGGTIYRSNNTNLPGRTRKLMWKFTRILASSRPDGQPGSKPFTLAGHRQGRDISRTRRDRIHPVGINTSVNLFSGFQVSNQLAEEELLAAVEDLNQARRTFRWPLPVIICRFS